MIIFSGMIPIRDAHRKFVDHLRDKNRSQSTVLAYGKDIDQLVEFLEELQKAHLTEISKEDIEAFLAKLLKNGYTPKSVSRKTNAVKTFFRFLKVNEFITDDPALLVSHPRFETKPPRILSETEYRALRDTVQNDARTYAIVELLLQTGMRIGELSRLENSDAKFGTAGRPGEIRVASFNRHPERTVPLNSRSQKALQAYLDERPKTKADHVFITRTGKSLLVRNIRSTIKRFLELAGIEDATVNDLRHTFIAHHLKRGASLVLVSKIAGHRRLSTTEKYLDHVEVTAPQEKMELAEL
ncbi:MAG TPA: tyrosine-type recombinase/integrase [Patescibacteria group bacterium]|nr:tyrosine-type recombinase/integrase [Patescibacteria group bacterium]